jgi:hypothetical protein
LIFGALPRTTFGGRRELPSSDRDTVAPPVAGEVGALDVEVTRAIQLLGCFAVRRSLH